VAHELPASGRKVRADQLLVARGLAPSRARAQALVLAGQVFTGQNEDIRVEKAGQLLASTAELSVRGVNEFVSRGGLKLQGALSDLNVDPTGLVCADVGASTGGFTDCLLRHGARKVYAIDVGKGQLAERLRTDARVVVLDDTNARFLEAEQVEGGVELAVVDASFISLEKLLPALARVILPTGRLLALIKPQFEVGREEARRTRGVIKDEGARRAAIERVLTELRATGFEVLGDATCRVPGPKGNVEHFALARR
jgi:23S rRNA (cytidine1920-2'-O)/16S rRNA (cytidine1409-2'-O)-methyltransferase